MKHILIPTDFTVHSLNAVHAAMATCDNEPVRITLLHLLRMPVDISEILFRSRHSRHLSLVTGEFREGCEILQNRYGTALYSLDIKFGFGSTAYYLDNLLEGEQVTDILVCTDISLSLPSDRSVEMLSVIKRTGRKITYVSSRVRKPAKELTTISSLAERAIKLPGNEIFDAVKK